MLNDGNIAPLFSYVHTSKRVDVNGVVVNVEISVVFEKEMPGSTSNILQTAITRPITSKYTMKPTLQHFPVMQSILCI